MIGTQGLLYISSMQQMRSSVSWVFRSCSGEYDGRFHLRMIAAISRKSRVYAKPCGSENSSVCGLALYGPAASVRSTVSRDGNAYGCTRAEPLVPKISK